MTAERIEELLRLLEESERQVRDLPERVQAMHAEVEALPEAGRESALRYRQFEMTSAVGEPWGRVLALISELGPARLAQDGRVGTLLHRIRSTSPGPETLIWGAPGEAERAIRDVETAVRRRQAVQRRAARGAFMGGFPPYGYRWDEESRTWAPEESELRVLLEMRRLRDQGLGVRRIAAELNRRGIPTPKGGETWRPSSVDRILKSPFYTRLANATPD